MRKLLLATLLLPTLASAQIKLSQEPNFVALKSKVDSGTFGGLNISTTAPTTGPSVLSNIYSLNQPSAKWGIVGYQFNALQSYDSFGDLNSHVNFLINGGKSTNAANTSGSWNMFVVDWTGYGGGTSSSFITAGQFIMEPTYSPNGNNNTGRYTGLNAECITRAGINPTSCVGLELNVSTAVAPADSRHGLLISDIGSASNSFGVTTDSAIVMTKQLTNTIGFKAGILFGSTGQTGTFPVTAGGDLIRANVADATMRSFADFSAMSAPTYAGIGLPANSRGICFAANCGGGTILSNTAANGGQLVFSNNSVSVNFASAVLTISNNGDVNALGGLRALQLSTALSTPSSSSAPCAAGNLAADTGYIYVCTATNTWKRAALTTF